MTLKEVVLLVITLMASLRNYGRITTGELYIVKKSKITEVGEYREEVEDYGCSDTKSIR